MSSALIALLLIGAVIWLWIDSLRARELAVMVCRRSCESESLQFLDDTVALASLRPSFKYGRPMVKRVYQFDFSREGDDRQCGTIILIGAHLETLYIPGQRDPTQDNASGGIVINLDGRQNEH